MMNVTIRDAYRYNLCTFFLLPLCKVTIISFGGYYNFINSWVHPEGHTMYVKVHSLQQCEPDAFECRYYLGSDGRMLGYRMPKIWLREFEHYKQGKWSEFSQQAKNFLKRYSGLPYLEPDRESSTGFSSDIRLLALDKDERLRLRIMEELGVQIEKGAELLEAPKETEFLII